VLVQAAKEHASETAVLAEQLPLLLASLQTDLKQSTRDLGTLMQAHSACSEVAKLASQV
jgi:hypothetical protein